MYQSNRYFEIEDNPTLAELMWARDLDPFNDDDCITFGKSIAKFEYNIPQDDFNDLLLEFVSEYLDERIGTGSLMQWMLHLRSYGMDRKGWYEDTYDLFKDIDRFAFLGRRVERDTNEDREKEEQGTRGTKRSEDEDNESTLARDVNENGSTLNTRTQDDVLTGLRDRQEDVIRANTNTASSTSTSEANTNESKTGDNKTTSVSNRETTTIGSDTEIATVEREGNTKGLTTTDINESVGDTINETTTSNGKTTTNKYADDTGSDVKSGSSTVSEKSKTDTDNTETLTTNKTDTTNATESTSSQSNSETDNTQKALKQNATGIGTATGPLGGPISEGSFGSRAPSSGVVKDSTFEEGQTRDNGTSSETASSDSGRDSKTTTTGTDTKTVDGVVDVDKNTTTSTNERVDTLRNSMENSDVTVSAEDKKVANNTSSKQGTHTSNTNEDTTGKDTTNKTFTRDNRETGSEDRTDLNEIRETTEGTSSENRGESSNGESEENTSGNTLENINDTRKVDEEANQTRTNTTDIDEELFRKLRRMVEEDQESKDLSKETNKGTMVETTTGDVVPLMELARRYYDLRVSSKNRWVKEARKLFKYNYNF